ncbi:MAG: hypothetical protein JNN30_08515 [Rhodanobacteraceae bacterium]|nr:hypothetical protein [Rhodanobacteraceae bacterium]
MNLRHVLCLLLFTVFSSGAYARQPHTPPTAAPPVRSATVYPIVVSFISIGEGVSYPSVMQFNTLVAEFEHTWGVAAQRVVSPWGREGEFDVCFTLGGLPAAARAELVDQLRLLDAEPLVAVAEDVACAD